MAFSGTLVAAGQGTGVVVATGAQTEIGRISALIESVELLTTPLLRQINRFGQRFTWITLSRRGPAVRVCRADPRLRLAGGADRRRCPGRGRHPRRSAGGDHHHARDRGAAHGRAQRGDPPSARGRNAGRHLGHLLGQDRHPDAQRDDGAPHRHRATSAILVAGSGYAPARRAHGDRGSDDDVAAVSAAAPADARRPPVQRRASARRGRSLARGRRSDGGGAGRARPEGGLQSRARPVRVAAPRRDPVRRPAPVHGDAPHGADGRARHLRQGRARAAARDVHRPGRGGR